MLNAILPMDPVQCSWVFLEPFLRVIEIDEQRGSVVLKAQEEIPHQHHLYLQESTNMSVIHVDVDLFNPQVVIFQIIIIRRALKGMLVGLSYSLYVPM